MFRRAGGKKENVRYVGAGALANFITEDLHELGDSFVIFADIGLAGPRLNEFADILEKRGNVVLLDHHITSSELAGRSWCDIRMEFCGCELLRQYLGLNDDSSYSLAAIVQDNDLWLKKIPGSEKIATFTAFAGQDVYVEKFLHRNVTHVLFTPQEEEMLAILEHRRDGLIEYELSKTLVRDLRWGHNVTKVGYVVCGDGNVSLLLDRMLEKFPQIEAACQISLDKGSVSFRSRGYDVAELCKYFGGGGHKKAAGHRIPKGIWERVIEDVHGV